MTKQTAGKRKGKGRAKSAEVLEARAFAYDVLRHAFLEEPSETFIKLLVEEKIIQTFPFAESSPGITEALSQVVSYLKQPGVLSRENYDHLHWDYTRMFIGPYEFPAPPWESVYRDNERLLFSETTLEVRDAYRKYHLLPKNLHQEADDHIGLELDFMHHLCEMARTKTKSGENTGLREILKDQKAFLDNHLSQWVPAWTADVVKSAETDFYKGMALLLDAYLKLDSRILEELLVRE